MDIKNNSHNSLLTYWNAKMFLIEVHQFHFIIGNLFLVGRLEHECDCVCVVLGLHCDNVIVSCTLEDLGHAETYDVIS